MLWSIQMNATSIVALLELDMSLNPVEVIIHYHQHEVDDVLCIGMHHRHSLQGTLTKCSSPILMESMRLV